MKTSLIITTYNWKDALAAVLESVLRQTQLPDEVIIADDGSKSDTTELIAGYRAGFPVPLIHSWQEDQGFRLAMSRNRAIARATGDLIVIIDGDMVLHKDFVADYKKTIKPGWFIQGGRVVTNSKTAAEIINNRLQPNFFTSGLKNRKNAISNGLLSKVFSREVSSIRKTRGCNMAFWRSDLVDVNGFNNDFIGWGREDSEIVVRLLNAGMHRLYLKFSAVAFHLYHNEQARASLPENDQLLNLAIKEKHVRCQNGLNEITSVQN